MPTFNIKYATEIDAENELEAAKKARKWIAEDGQIFTVQNQDTRECFSIDLAEEDEYAVLPLMQGQFYEKDTFSKQ